MTSIYAETATGYLILDPEHLGDIYEAILLRDGTWRVYRYALRVTDAEVVR